MDALNKPLPTARQQRETCLIFKLTDMQGGLSFSGIALVFFGLILIGNVPIIILLAVLLALPCLALGQTRNAVKFSARPFYPAERVKSFTDALRARLPCSTAKS